VHRLFEAAFFSASKNFLFSCVDVWEVTGWGWEVICNIVGSKHKM